jgi:hypothetical protein
MSVSKKLDEYLERCPRRDALVIQALRNMFKEEAKTEAWVEGYDEEIAAHLGLIPWATKEEERC